MDDRVITKPDELLANDEFEKSMQSTIAAIEEEEKKSLEERLLSKEWKVRKKAYTELLEDLEKDKEMFRLYNSFYPKFFDETNPHCQEIAVDVVKFLITNCSLRENQQIDFFKQLIEKFCLSQKAICKTKSKELVLDLYEKVNQTPLLESIKLLLENKKKTVSIIYCRLLSFQHLKTFTIFFVNSALLK